MFKTLFSRIIVSSLLWLLIVLVLICAYTWQWLNTEHSIPKEHQILMVEKGHGLRHVAKSLKQAGILRWPLVWRIYARVMQPQTIKAGEYALSPYESPISLLNLLQGGEVISYKITFAEGLTLKEWLALMAQEPKLKSVVSQIPPEDLLAKLNIDSISAEGWFFPDTYRYEKDDSDLDILIRAHQKMETELIGQWARRQPSLPLDSPYEALILASIIEEETGIASERPQIASVFTRRLKYGMRLQTDPTVIYGMGDAYQGRIRKVDLQTPTAHNTYIIKGLPPTPISNPGRAAIAAAINPGDSPFLYFVAKGDGSHHFSRSLEEHNQAVKQYQHKRKSNYTSTPPKLEAVKEPTQNEPQNGQDALPSVSSSAASASENSNDSPSVIKGQ